MARDKASASSLPPAEACVLRYVLERRAHEKRRDVFLVEQNGTEWTFGVLHDEVVRTANAFRALGVSQSDYVLSWLPNGIDALIVWFALNYLGAIYVPINTAYRGRLLEQVVANSGARLMVAHAELLPRLAAIDKAKLEQVVAVGEGVHAVDGLRVLPQAVLTSTVETPPPLERRIKPWDTQSIIYTSGTTGPSKGVLSSYVHLFAIGESHPALGEHDRFLVNLPLFHVSGTAWVYAMLMLGGSVALVESFRTDAFWETVRRTRSTTTQLLGVMAQFLLKQPPSAADCAHTLKSALVIPLAEDNHGFSQRFGVDIFTIYNMTEMPVPTGSGINPANPRSCGKVRPGLQVRIVDENDCEVPAGQIGELIVRADRPWTISHGYHNHPEATARTWRNGWFHTGDAFRCDDNGDFYFVDRIKDAIRRRGENISSFEVETAVCEFPAVKEVAAVGVPGALSEEEILVVVTPAPGKIVVPAELVRFLQDRLPYFMVPRYVRVMPELPKTPTQKVQKAVLRETGITPDTWDRETDPTIIVRRERLQASGESR
ncbi:AMP-binding protein [Reyranella sp.]|uniref:AMP-binding protein n=1 Tax=Reyranella sp. TaxID=1929291 RepID=UPI0037849DB2